ncbi:hypothetical protein N431DRAFT_368425 [Stipitochalara longipes BDJ]|nr:hypothetical protein N431DRAFT_368425 [Stipitochalara longipes BDJ]
MENEKFNFAQALPSGNSNMAFDRFWESYDGQPASSNEARPTQPAPFFQFSGCGNTQRPSTTDPTQSLSSQTHVSQAGSSFRHPDTFNAAQWQSAGSTQTSRTQQVNKRQKIAHPTSLSYEDSTAQVLDERGDEESVAGPESECCSSCSDGIPCASPDCAPCSEPGCNSKTIELIPCNKKACEQPACTDQCLSSGIQGQQALLGIVPKERVMSNLVEPPWNPQQPRDVSRFEKGSLNGILDPALKVFDGPEYASASASASPIPTTPSMGNNVPTPYGTNTGMPTPQLGLFPGQSDYSSHSGDVLSGTGAIFNSLSQAWSEQTFSQSNDPNCASMFQCTWDGCYMPFQSYEDWLPHLHKDHVDPQMVFGCPIQAENCPQTISTNPLDHLQIDHGFNFNMDTNNFSCPAPNCLPTEIFCDPAMLHNHFDHAHATPAQGGLRCRLEKTCDFFGDYSELFSHINEQHQLPPISRDEEIDLSLPPPPDPAITARPDYSPEEGIVDAETGGMSSGDETVHYCMWKTNAQMCGLICQSEVELQTHIKCIHLDSLDKRSGYKCLWEDCKRKEMPFEKQGFSQRGKLERHMATHTNFKCSICDVCGQKFSAPQSMKQHRLLHTGEKPWKCKHCGKAFPQQSACTIHERTHTNEKPLECSICGKKFSESSNLSKHRKIHGEKGLHVCNIEGCGKSFHRLDQLKRHASTHERKRLKAASSESDSTVTKLRIDGRGDEDLLSDI